MNKLMVLGATEKNREQFHLLINELDEMPTHLLVNPRDVVAIEWANYQSPTVKCITTVPDHTRYGRTADFRDIGERLAQADILMLLGSTQYKKYTDTLEKASKLEIPVYRV